MRVEMVVEEIGYCAGDIRVPPYEYVFKEYLAGITFIDVKNIRMEKIYSGTCDITLRTSKIIAIWETK